MTAKTGKHALIEQLIADGVEYMFGNPGTVEQGFLDTLEEYPQLKYILTQQETIAVAMADGYARASGKLGLVQLHSSVGVGNGIGMLYQAMRGHAPLLVIAGEAGVQYDAMDAQMAVDLVAMTKPVTKYATRVTDSRSLLRVLRRAIKIATTAPCGPVFVSLPMDILDAPMVGDIVPTTVINTRSTPEASAIASAATMLANASHPLILMGDGITFSGAQQQLTQVAELLGAKVYGVNSSEVNIPASHPLYGGTTGHMFGFYSKNIVQQADVVLVCGTYIFPEVFPDLTRPFSDGAKLIHIDLNSYEIAKNFDTDLALLGDPKHSLAAVAAAIAIIQTVEQQVTATKRITAAAKAKAEAHDNAVANDNAQKDAMPMKMASFMQVLAAHSPENLVVFDEGLTSGPAITRYLSPDHVGNFYQTRGGSLGVGIPGGLGARLARPEQPVIVFTGDGGSMYTIQALWTAAKYQINTKFVICNNGAYQLLRLNIDQYWQERDIPAHDHPSSFDLSQPVVDFVTVAKGLHVPGLKVTTPAEAEAAVKAMWALNGPFLLDVVIDDH
jgi:thiamine pyrophosphate-dependent acetolactate synthase large subunit-like protein